MKLDFLNGKFTSITLNRLMWLDRIRLEINPSITSLLAVIYMHVTRRKRRRKQFYTTRSYLKDLPWTSKNYGRSTASKIHGEQSSTQPSRFSLFHAIEIKKNAQYQLNYQIVSRYWITGYLSTKGFIRTSIPILLFGITTRCLRLHWLLYCKKRKLLTCTFVD